MELIKSENYETHLCNFYEDNQSEVWLTREQIGAALGYADPAEAIKTIHKRHKDRLDKFIKREKVKTTEIKTSVEGGQSDPSRRDISNSNLQSEVVFYSERGVMEICRWSDMPKADEFMDWVWDIIEAYRRNEIVATQKAIQEQNKAIQMLIEHTRKLEQLTLETKEQLSIVQKDASTALAGVNALNSGVVTGFGRETEWINEVSVELEKLAKHWGRHDPQLCVIWIIDELDGKDGYEQIAPYKFIEYKRKYIMDHPGTKPTRLTVVASDSQYRAIFTEVLHRKLQDYNEEFNEDSSLFSRMIVELGDPIWESPNEHEPDWNDPAFLALCDELDAYHRRQVEMDEAIAKANISRDDDFDDIID